MQQAYDQAIAQYETVLKTQPKAAAPYVLLSMLYDYQGKSDKGSEYYQKALQIDPKAVAPANNLAWYYAERGTNLDEALTLARTAKERLPTHPDVTDTLGWVYHKKAEYSRAVNVLQEGVKAHPNNPTLRYHLGIAYYKTEKKDLAKTELQQALKLQANFPGAQAAKDVLASLK